jgi:hypothetical protein
VSTAKGKLLETFMGTNIVRGIMTILDWLALIAPSITAVGVLVAVLTLRANHDWNRRQYAMQILADWNPQTSEHRKAIESAFPGLIDVDRNSNKVVELSRARAAEIYESKPGSPDWDLKFHFIELGNYFEFICSSYIHHVADHDMIEQAFRYMLIRWHGIMLTFIDTIEHHRGYRPWQPFSDLVEYWQRPHKIKLRPRAGLDALFSRPPRGPNPNQ